MSYSRWFLSRVRAFRMSFTKKSLSNHAHSAQRIGAATNKVSIGNDFDDCCNNGLVRSATRPETAASINTMKKALALCIS